MSDGDVLKQLERRNRELARFVAILVERSGGEVRIGPDELGRDYSLSRDEIGLTGVIVLRTSA